MAKRKDKTELTEQDARKVFQRVMRCRPLISKQEMEDIEVALSTQALGVSRRVGLATAMQDGKWFKRLSIDRDMAVSIAGQMEAVWSAAETLNGVANLLERAHWRASVALCKYEDMHKIFEEGKGRAVVSLGSLEASHG